MCLARGQTKILHLMTKVSKVEEIPMEMNMDQAEEAMKLRDATIKLFKNKDYKKVFEEGYFKAEAMRLPLALVDNEMQDDIEQRILKEKIAAIGHLHVYLNSVINLGNQVEASLEAQEKEKVEASKSIEYDEVTGDPYEVEDV